MKRHRRSRFVLRAALPGGVAALMAMVILFTVAEGLLAAAGVIPRALTEDPWVGFSGRAPLFVPTPDGRAWETAANKRDYFPVQSFPEEKSPDTVRVFCLGGSTTAGRPYGDDTSYCAWLRELLPAADPSRRWEVVNAGGISYASYRVARVMEELLAHAPDVFIIYTGHNEFLERRTYDPLRRAQDRWGWLTRLLDETRVYTIVARAVGTRPRRAGEPLPEEVAPILDRSVGPEAYVRDDAFAREVAAHFEANLRRMAAMARAAGAKVVFVTPASNVADCAPFKSEPDASLEDAGRRALAACRRAAEADPARYAECLSIDPRLPEALYGAGCARLEAGDLAEARRLLGAARDEDICPLRASTPLVEAVRRVALEEGAAVVDYVALLDRETGGLPGDGQFVDHVHPGIGGHGRLARALVRGLCEAGVLPAGDVDDAAYGAVAARVEARVDDADRARALRTLARVYAWAGKHEQSRDFAARAFALAPDDPENREQLALLTLSASQRAALDGRSREALELAGEAVRLSNRRSPPLLDWLSECHARSGEREAALAVAREALALPDLEAYGGLALALAERVRALSPPGAAP